MPVQRALKLCTLAPTAAVPVPAFSGVEEPEMGPKRSSRAHVPSAKLRQLYSVSCLPVQLTSRQAISQTSGTRLEQIARLKVNVRKDNWTALERNLVNHRALKRKR